MSPTRTPDRHHSMVLADNSRVGPGRGPAPSETPARWWWLRWRMFDALMWDALDALPAEQLPAVLSHWPAGWPSPGSGLMAIRQMEWVRVSLIGGRDLDARQRGFL